MDSNSIRAPLRRAVLATLFAGTLASIVRVSTSPYGPGLTNDSPRYSRSAESLLIEGRLEILMTGWDQQESTRTLFRHTPLLPALVAAIHWLTPLDIEDSARWLNAFCLFGTTLLILRPAHLRFLSVFVFAALILGPALWETHLFPERGEYAPFEAWLSYVYL